MHINTTVHSTAAVINSKTVDIYATGFRKSTNMSH